MKGCVHVRPRLDLKGDFWTVDFYDGRGVWDGAITAVKDLKPMSYPEALRVARNARRRMRKVAGRKRVVPC